MYCSHIKPSRCLHSIDFPKLDLPLCRGLFLFILHENEAKGGWVGIFFYYKSIESLNITSNIIFMDFIAMYYTSSKLVGISTIKMYAFQSS